jgi:cyanate permease
LASIGSRRPGAAFVVAVALGALNLRTVFASLPPLLDDLLLGLAHDVVGGWTVVLAGLIVITLAELPAGAVATRAWTIGVEEH